MPLFSRIDGMLVPFTLALGILQSTSSELLICGGIWAI